jgi:hypothetical protein
MKWNELMRVLNMLDTGKNSLSGEEILFIQTCCQILRTESASRVITIGAMAVNASKGDLF